jgi:starch synthase
MVQFYCETGGLKDTVIDFGDNGNGISHDQFPLETSAILFKGQSTCIRIRAFKCNSNTGMNTDHSWEKKHVKNI